MPAELLPLLQAVREHLLSTLRLTLHPDAQLFDRPIWMFAADPNKHRFAITMTQHFATPTFDAARARNVFVGTFNMRNEVRLMVEGGDQHIPLQYRYLSLYKLLELHFKSKGRWRKTDLRNFLSPFADSFRKVE